MRRFVERLSSWADWLDQEDPEEPAFDPVQLGAALVICLVAVGALFWLLWTLLVFEGGIEGKVAALARLAGGKPYSPDDFEGWLGNVGALALSIMAFAGLRRLYVEAARRAEGK